MLPGWDGNMLLHTIVAPEIKASTRSQCRCSPLCSHGSSVVLLRTQLSGSGSGQLAIPQVRPCIGLAVRSLTAVFHPFWDV